MARKFNNPINSRPRALMAGLLAGALAVGVGVGTHSSSPNSIESGITAQAAQLGEGHQASLVGLYPITVHHGIGKAALHADILLAVAASEDPTTITLAEVTCEDASASGVGLGTTTENDLLGMTNPKVRDSLQETDAFAALKACFDGLDARLVKYDAEIATGQPPIPTAAATPAAVHA